MTPAAWTMLIVTWGVIIFFTVNYFGLVLVTPDRADRLEPTSDGIPEKDP